MKLIGILRGESKSGRVRWLPIGLAVASLSVLGFRQVDRWNGAQVVVVVAAAAIPKGTVLDAAHLGTQTVRDRQVPQGAVRSLDQARGRLLTVAKNPGAPILQSDLRKPPAADAHLSAMIPEGRVLTSLTVKNIVVPLQDLRRGDRLDILAAGVGENQRRVSRIVARDAFVIGFARTGPAGGESAPRDAQGKRVLGVDVTPPSVRAGHEEAQALILALRPADVIPVAEVDGSDAHISLVVHSRDDVRDGELLSIVPRTSLRTVEVIVGQTRERVTIP